MSMYDPYYSRIQGLLFEGISIKDVWQYMAKYFGIHADYSTFYKYVKRRKLDFFMPVAR